MDFGAEGIGSRDYSQRGGGLSRLTLDVRHLGRIEAIHRFFGDPLVQEEFGSFAEYSWRFVGGAPIINHRTSSQPLPATTKESDAFSKDLKARGFKFVGSTIIYAHMQATGMVNDHLLSCARHAALVA